TCRALSAEVPLFPGGPGDGGPASAVPGHLEFPRTRQPLDCALDSERGPLVAATVRRQELDRPAPPRVAGALPGTVCRDAGAHVSGNAAIEGPVPATREVDPPRTARRYGSDVSPIK